MSVKDSIDVEKEVRPVLVKLRNRIHHLLDVANSPDRQQIEHNTTVARWRSMENAIIDLEEELDECEEHL